MWRAPVRSRGWLAWRTVQVPGLLEVWDGDQLAAIVIGATQRCPPAWARWRRPRPPVFTYSADHDVTATRLLAYMPGRCAGGQPFAPIYMVADDKLEVTIHD